MKRRFNDWNSKGWIKKSKFRVHYYRETKPDAEHSFIVYAWDAEGAAEEFLSYNNENTIISMVIKIE